jgi:hypothetical protein
MLYSEIIAVCSQIHKTLNKNFFWGGGGSADFGMLNRCNV